MWNRDSIPTTQTMNLLETRILSQERYPDLPQHIQSEISGIRRFMSDTDYPLPKTMSSLVCFRDIGDGKVTMSANRDWVSGGRENSLVMAMDAESGEMVIWYLIDTPSN